ncbi:MAG: C10 family peptidase [Bacteroidota bacterium]|nr:C10 family peptidase [Bacteroidota bacterium]
MKKIILICISALSGFLSQAPATAQSINRETGSQIAKNFFYERIQKFQAVAYEDIQVLETFTEYESGEAVLYIYNMAKEGYVILAAHASTRPVLGFSFTGSFDPLNLPPQMQGYLHHIKQQLFENYVNDVQASPEELQEWDRLKSKNEDHLQVFSGRSIEPMLFTTWDQGTYYNEMCPVDPAGPGGHCYTGCVATALGQLINYFRWPLQGTGSYTYECPPYGTLSVDYSEADYGWNEMPLELNISNPPTAELLYHLGVSCDMVYGPNGSGMYNHKAAYSLRTFFKYSPETQYVYRDSTSMDWDSLLLSHLDRQMPMYYAGWSVPNVNGHAFICDGYQEPGYYHFNWGWSGSYDGYFYTDDLTPGGSYFNDAQELIINAFPDTTNYTYPYYGAGLDTLTTYHGTLGDGSSPNYPYQDNYYHKWLIKPADSVEFINLEFLKFETADNDILTIYDGEDSLSPVLGTYSGNETPEPIISSGDAVLLTFLTDAGTNAPGWLLSYVSEIPVYCSGLSMMSLPSDTFSDGSGPAVYHNMTNCLWKIQAAGNTEITLQFLEFDTEEENDVLKVYDGTDLLAELSGNEIPEDITAHSGSMFLTFSTNSNIRKQGWKAVYESDAVGTKEIQSETGISIFPNPAKDKLTIRQLNSRENLKVSIFDMQGCLLLKEESRNKHEHSMNIGSLKPGIYLLQISGGDSLFVKKLVVY